MNINEIRYMIKNIYYTVYINDSKHNIKNDINRKKNVIFKATFQK